MVNQSVTIILDDGYESEYSLAFPLFKQYGVNGCSAVTSSFIGKTKTGTDEPYATLEQLLEMQRYGWEILSHGKTHKELAKISIYEAESEIKFSKMDLIGMGLNVSGLVYPCHSINDDVKYLASQNYKYARGKHGTDTSDKYNLSGIMLDNHTEMAHFKHIIDNSKWTIFYIHLCTSKFIASTLTDRMNTLQEVLEYCKTKNVAIKTLKEMI